MSKQHTTISVSENVDTTFHRPEETAVLPTSVVEAASHYVLLHDFAVFPCLKGEKRPATSNGFKDATKDVNKVASLFQGEHNLAICTGAESDLFVLDVDMPGGDESLDSLENAHEQLPDTVTVTTPRGGKHYYFRLPDDVLIKNSVGKLGNKLDVRGEGGYVVAPPSSTLKGEYKWEPGKNPDETPIANAPSWLINAITELQENKAGATNKSPATTASRGKITEGSRNSELTSLGGSMRRRGFSKGAIYAALAAENSERCSPPLQASEIVQITRSIARYTPELPSISTDASLPYRDFPINALPTPLAEFVSTGAEAIGCDPSYIALPLLSGLASAIGNSFRIELKPGWEEPAIVWTAIVGYSGTMKSPGLETALRAVRDRQSQAQAAYEFALADYQQERNLYERELAAWRRSRSAADPPSNPEKPVLERTWADDITVEALALKLQENPNGILVARDELAGWLGSFDRYSQSSGGDGARWLEIYGARQLVVDRKTGEPPTICVPRANVSITGNIQPGVLDRSLSNQHRESGLAARLLLAYPPRKTKKWSETELDSNLVEHVAKVYERLYRLKEDGLQVLPLNAGAKKQWINFYNEHAREQAELDGDLAAAFSKLEGYCARLALVLHLATWAGSECPKPEPIREDSVQRARKLIEWFKYETRRVYAVLGASEDAKEQLKVLDRVRALGGRATPRDLTRSSRNWPDTESAERDLNRLADLGLGKWEITPPGKEGGRPKRSLVLNAVASADKSLLHTKTH